MEFVGYLLGALVLAGVGLAIYERRKGKTLMKHDGNLDARAQSETDRHAIRFEDHNIN